MLVINFFVNTQLGLFFLVFMGIKIKLMSFLPKCRNKNFSHIRVKNHTAALF